jgi:hypothetical protein
MTRIQMLIIAAVLGAASTGAASTDAVAAGKKVYCWDDHGRKVCGDALPAEAAASARTEISVKSGMHTGNVAASLTSDERAAAALAAEQAQVAADAEATRQRRDLAMVESYATEADLRRAYGERISLLDDALKTSTLGEANLRLSLASLLDQASDLELAGKPVVPVLTVKVRAQHEELKRQTRILTQQQHDRGALDGDLADAVARYRALKQAPVAGTAVTSPAPPPAPTPGV